MPQVLQRLQLFLRQQLTARPVQPQLGGNGLGGLPAVAGEHDLLLHPQRPQLPHRLRRVLLHGIPEHQSPQIPAVGGHEDLGPRHVHLRHRNGEAPQIIRPARQNPAAPPERRHPPAGQLPYLGSILWSVGTGGQKGLSHRVVGAAFRRRRGRKERFFRHPLRRKNFHHRELSLSEGSGLVKGGDLCPGQSVQEVAALHQNAPAGGSAHPGEETEGHGNHQSAGTGDHQEAQGVVDAVPPGIDSQHRRDHGDPHRQGADDGGIDPGKAGNELLTDCLVL